MTVFKNTLGYFFPTALDCSLGRTVGQDLHLLFACALHKERPARARRRHGTGPLPGGSAADQHLRCCKYLEDVALTFGCLHYHTTRHKHE